MPRIPTVPPPRPKKRRLTRFDVVPPAIRVPLLLAVLVVLLAMLLPPVALNTARLERVFGEPSAALILTAHPDDEAMFFSPTILGLREAGWHVKGLCLSNGDAGGLGNVRRGELLRSYDNLGVAPQDVTIFEHPLVQDDIRTQWPQEVVQGMIAAYMDDNDDVSLVVTFDKYGISGHPNHVSLSKYRPPSGVTLAHLQTPPLALKYTGPFISVLDSIAQLPLTQGANSLASFALNAIPLTKAFVARSSSRAHLRVDKVKWWQAVTAMREHASQMLWFRWLYLATSQMLWSNTLQVM